MAIYTIHAPPAGRGSDEPTAFVTIKDGFCWPALFIPLVWTVYRRLWVVLCLAILGLVLLGFLAPLGGTVVGGIYVLGRIYYALEANGLRRWTLERRGYRLVGLAEGRGIEEAERHFFAIWQGDDAAAPAARPAAAPETADGAPPASPEQSRPVRRSMSDPQIVGLFPSPGAAR